MEVIDDDCLGMRLRFIAEAEWRDTATHSMKDTPPHSDHTRHVIDDRGRRRWKCAVKAIRENFSYTWMTPEPGERENGRRETQPAEGEGINLFRGRGRESESNCFEREDAIEKVRAEKCKGSAVVCPPVRPVPLQLDLLKIRSG